MGGSGRGRGRAIARALAPEEVGMANKTKKGVRRQAPDPDDEDAKEEEDVPRERRC